MVLKLDLEKAFDHLEWAFVHEVLDFLHFPEHITHLILHCISSPSVNVLLNGGRLESFLPSLGITQGDPMSPCIFILYLEYLSILINREVEGGHWKELQLPRGTIALSQLFFADDLVLLGEANEVTCDAMIRVLGEFCSRSGQRINFAKSRVCFSPNTTQEPKRAHLSKLGVEEKSQFGKYLGFHMDMTLSDTNSFNFLIDKI